MPEVNSNSTGDTDLRLAATVLSHREYMLLLTVLRQQVTTGALTDEDFAHLLFSLVAEDLVGDSWTYAPDSGSWFEVGEEEWVEGEPRGPLLVAMPESCSELLRGISGRIEQAERDVRRELQLDEGAVPEPPVSAKQSYCTRCGTPLKTGQGFCTICGTQSSKLTEAGAVRRCPGCGKAVGRKLAFCTGCGIAVPGAVSDD